MTVYSVIKLTLVSGSESTLLSTRTVLNNADAVPFGDVFKISVDKERLYACSIQLNVASVIGSHERCLVIAWLLFLLYYSFFLFFVFCFSF